MTNADKPQDFIPMTEEDRRAKLRQVFTLLAELDDGLAVSDFDPESLAIETATEALKAGFHRDYASTCEGCGAVILSGDQGHRCLEGELLCKECTPTWADVKQQWDSGELSDDEDSDKASFMRRYIKHIADGGKPDDLMLYTL